MESRRQSLSGSLRSSACSLAFVVFVVLVRGLEAQQGVLFINEVMPANQTQEPTDIAGEHPDMLEIYNASDQVVALGTSTSAQSYYLSDTSTFDPLTAWKFSAGRSNIPPTGRLVIFCDQSGFEGVCELHASFAINNDGSEPITLWGPELAPGMPRPIIDQVWLPPMRADISFGRFPDGAGPAPVPLEETFDVFRFHPPGSSTFGSCVQVDAMPGCPGNVRRYCLGAPNGEGGNLEPHVDRVAHTTNHPAANKAVDFIVRVDDDKEPVPGNIVRVEIRYSVDAVEQAPVEMTYDSLSGVLTGSSRSPPRPLERWTLWRGSIPGQPAGSRVEFEFFVEDREGLSSADPSRTRCPAGTGPCNEVGLPGPGCVQEDCQPAPGVGCQFVACDHRHQYLAGYTPPEPLRQVLINEVMAVQDRILRDATDLPCDQNNPNCGYDDFIEICNGSDQPVDFSGLWLSDRLFQPQAWQFPPGSVIQPGEYLLVWADGDGGRCPHAPELLGDGQECPDPNDADTDFHTNFRLESGGDQVFLHGREENGFGVIHGVEFGPQELNVSLSLMPDCTRTGVYRATPGGSPRAPTPTPQPVFRRGDANGDCAVNITDPTYTLNFLFLGGPVPDCPDAADADNSGNILLTDAVYGLNFLFLGGPRPPDPGPFMSGPDPLPADGLGECSEPACQA